MHTQPPDLSFLMISQWVCCEHRYIQVADLEQCWRNNDASFVIPDCESEVSLLVQTSRQKIRVQQGALHPKPYDFNLGVATCTSSWAILFAAVHAAVPDTS